MATKKIETDVDLKGKIDATGTVLGSNLSGTNTGDQDLSAYALTSVSDGKYLLNTTDTLTGNLTVTGNVSATYGNFSGNVGVSATPTVYSGFSTLAIGNSSQGGVLELQYSGLQAGRIAAVSAGTLSIVINNTEALRLNSDRSATFASSVSATDGTFSGDVNINDSKLQITNTTPQIILSVPSGGLDSRIYNDGAGNFIIGHGANSATPPTVLTIATDKSATFASSVSAVGTITGSNLSGINTGDQDLSGYLLNTTDTLTGVLTIDGNVISSYNGTNPAIGAYGVDRTLIGLSSNARGYKDETIIDNPSNSTVSYAGIDIKSRMENGTFDHVTMFQGRTSFDAAVMTTIEGFYMGGIGFENNSSATNYVGLTVESPSANATITNFIGTKVFAPSRTGNVITNFYGLKIDDNISATNKWAIHSPDNSVKSLLAGQLESGDITVNNTGTSASINLNASSTGSGGNYLHAKKSNGTSQWVFGSSSASSDKVTLKQYNAADIVIENNSGDAIVINTLGNSTFIGNATATDFILSSDVRLKKDFLPLSSKRLSPTRWTWKNSGKKDFGFIAQELEVDFPEVVVTGEDGFKKVAYNKITAINAARINELEDEVFKLKRKLKLIMQKLDI